MVGLFRYLMERGFECRSMYNTLFFLILALNTLQSSSQSGGGMWELTADHMVWDYSVA